MQLCSPLCSEGTNKACYVRLGAEERRGVEGGVGPLGRRASPLFLPSNTLTASNKLIIALGVMPTLRFPLKAVAGRREDTGGHHPAATCV